MIDLFSSQYIETFDVGMSLVFALVTLIVLYAITLIHHKLRIIESELNEIKGEQNIQSEELESLAKISSNSQEEVKIEIPDQVQNLKSK